MQIQLNLIEGSLSSFSGHINEVSFLQINSVFNCFVFQKKNFVLKILTLILLLLRPKEAQIGFLLAGRRQKSFFIIFTLLLRALCCFNVAKYY